MGVAARAEEASGEALCGVRRTNDRSLAGGASRDVSSEQRGGHMTADRGHPRPRSPPGGSGILLPAGRTFMRPGRALRWSPSGTCAAPSEAGPIRRSGGDR